MGIRGCFLWETTKQSPETEVGVAGHRVGRVEPEDEGRTRRRGPGRATRYAACPQDASKPRANTLPRAPGATRSALGVGIRSRADAPAKSRALAHPHHVESRSRTRAGRGSRRPLINSLAASACSRSLTETAQTNQELPKGNSMTPVTKSTNESSVPAPSNARLQDPLLRPEEAARLLSVRTSWIYEAVRARRLPCVRVGRHIRFTQRMLEEWLADNIHA